jgi:anti-sigma-K factor RskA
VIYVPKRGTVVFFANYFAPAPKDKVYQLWLLPASGNAPMPCGTFKPDQLGMASFTMEGMPEDVQAKNFAVTLEPSGGSQKPTMPLLMTASARFPTE